MSIIRWNPLLTRPMSQWPDLWDEDIFSSAVASFTNNLDVYETENDVVVRANVAGVSEKDLDITFEKGILWIKASRSEEQTDEKKKHFSKAAWDYSYKVAVPGMLDSTAEPQLELNDGMLVITFKKAEASKPKKLSVSKGSKKAA